MSRLFSGPFLFLRHGRTELNARGLIAGSTDVPLDETGFEEAAAAAELLVGSGVAAIWCSPMLRARQTAAPVAARLGLAVRVVAELAERNWGALEGRPRDAVHPEATPHGAETPERFAARTQAGLARIGPPAPVLIVAHAGSARMIAGVLAPNRPIRRVGNGEVVLWTPQGKGWAPRSLNGGPLETVAKPPRNRHISDKPRR